MKMILLGIRAFVAPDNTDSINLLSANCFKAPNLCSGTLQGPAQASLYSMSTPKVK